MNSASNKVDRFTAGGGSNQPRPIKLFFSEKRICHRLCTLRQASFNNPTDSVNDKSYDVRGKFPFQLKHVTLFFLMENDKWTSSWTHCRASIYHGSMLTSPKKIYSAEIEETQRGNSLIIHARAAFKLCSSFPAIDVICAPIPRNAKLVWCLRVSHWNELSFK